MHIDCPSLPSQHSAAQPLPLLTAASLETSCAAIVANPSSGHPRATSSAPAVRWRELDVSDLPAIIDLLREGFPRRARQYWVEGLARMAGLSTPAGFPQFGYMLESGGAAVGVLLLISRVMEGDGGNEIRCNVSSWYFKPQFRSFGSLLVLRAIRRQPVTYMNVSPARATWHVIEAQGFRPYSNGTFAALPALSTRRQRATLTWIAGGQTPRAAIPSPEFTLLADHAEFNCMSLWCKTADDGLSFIFKKRFVGPARIPCAQLIYCRSLDDLVKFQGVIGRALLLRGIPILLVASNGPLPGLAGKFYDGVLPMYYKGANPPPLGDLRYTEAALFGF